MSFAVGFGRETPTGAYIVVGAHAEARGGFKVAVAARAERTPLLLHVVTGAGNVRNRHTDDRPPG